MVKLKQATKASLRITVPWQLLAHRLLTREKQRTKKC